MSTRFPGGTGAPPAQSAPSPHRGEARGEGARADGHGVNRIFSSPLARRLAKQANIDLLLMLPHKHNLYERLFFKGHTQGILHAMPVPVMSICND